MTVKEFMEKFRLENPDSKTKDSSLKRQYYKLKKKGRLEEVEGDKEYTPKHELTAEGYKVYYSNTYIIATHEQIRKALMMYCVGQLTLNQVALAMNWTRAEFNAIKTSFHITKDSPPFTPYEIDSMTAEEMAELIRIEKKRYSLAKFEQNKHSDIVKEIKRYNEADYFINRIIQGLNDRRQNDFKIVPFNKESELIYSIRITDVHAGLEVSSIYNNYNLAIMRKRFEKVLSFAHSEIPKGSTIILTDGGDTTHGLIHGSVEKHGTYVITATIEVIECYDWLISELLKDYRVKFSKCNGSHESLERNKQNRTEQENIGRLISYSLKKFNSNNPNFEYIDTLLGLNRSVIPIFNFHVLLCHGDAMTPQKYAEHCKELNESFDFNIREVWLGHYHSHKVFTFGKIKVEHTIALCGSDQYASQLGLASPFGFSYTTYSKKGREQFKEIYLTD